MGVHGDIHLTARERHPVHRRPLRLGQPQANPGLLPQWRRGPQPAERAADADGSDGSETSVSGLHAAEQVREARAYVSGVEKRLKAVQRLFVQGVLGWVQPTLRWAELSDLVLCLLGQCTNRVYHARYD